MSTQNVLKDELEQFAADTRHRAQQYETPEQAAHLLRKMLASHVRCVPWADVYVHVSPGDYNRFKKRAEMSGPSIASRAPPSAAFFASLAEQASMHPDSEMGSYVDSYGEDVGESNQGRALALMMCRACNGDVRTLCKNLYGDDAVHAERERIYDAVTGPAGDLLQEGDQPLEVAQDLGLIICGTQFPSIHSGALFVSEPIVVRSPENNEAKETALGITREWPMHVPSEVDWSTQKDLQDWKHQHVLSALFPDEKVAKQMVLMHHAPSHVYLLQEHNILGKFQQPDDMLRPESEGAVANAYKGLLQQAPDARLQGVWETPSVQAFVGDLCARTPSRTLDALSKQDVLCMYMQAQRENADADPQLMEAILHL